MGYCYTKRGILCCDHCDAEGAKKRHCPHKVNGLPYCPAPALCDACWESLGKSKVIHGGCKDRAAQRQAEEDERSRQLAAGRLERSTAWGDWHEAVPKGLVGVCFRGIGNRQEYRLLPHDSYAAHQWLDEYTDTIPWEAHPV